jgi:hypothetical protein
MNRRPGHVDVTTEVGYCNFCQRPRNLRTEAHHLGTLVRTIVTCETCHRTLSSTMGVATAPEPEAAEVQPQAETEVVEAAAPKRAATAAKKPAAAAKKPAAKKPAAKKPAAKKEAEKKAPPAKPRSTATRKTTRAR